MGIQSDILFQRLKTFAVRIVKMYVRLPKTEEARVFGKQIIRSGSSVGAHYAEARRAKSNADYISKMQGGLQELEETGYWLDLLADSGIVPSEKILGIKKESEELISIFVAILRTAKKNKMSEQHSRTAPP